MSYTQINAWLDRRFPLPRCFYVGAQANTSATHLSAWMSVEERLYLHEVHKAAWISLSENTKRTRAYVAAAIKLLGGEDQVTEVDDKRMVIAELGKPPRQSLPIYIISTRKGSDETVVYVGQTSANNRFAGGHSAALKLHAPEYRDFDKLVYRCSVTLALDDDHVALEWVEPTSVAQQILNDVESHLIYEFQPPLNTHKKKKNLASRPIDIHIQNVVDGLREGSFLNDYFVQFGFERHK